MSGGSIAPSEAESSLFVFCFLGKEFVRRKNAPPFGPSEDKFFGSSEGPKGGSSIFLFFFVSVAKRAKLPFFPSKGLKILKKKIFFHWVGKEFGSAFLPKERTKIIL